MGYRHRIAEAAIKRLLKVFPAVGVTGPRQSGKSTLLKHLLNDYEYVTFDDIRNIQLFEDDPVGFMSRYREKVIFDEVQLVPGIFNAVKLAIDENRQTYGNFILTSSSQFAFLKSVTESLAGRIGLLSLLPLEFQEMPKALVDESVFKGCYPALVLRSYEESDLWYSSYIDTYLNKDVRALIHIGDIRDFRRFLLMLAAQTAQVLDMTHYAKNIGVSVPTIKRWISVLEASYIIFLVSPYHKNLSKRLIKSPKVYFFDTGLVSYLTGIATFEQYDRGPLAGPLFENYVISEIYKKELHTLSQADLYYFRTTDKVEIDLIIDRKSSVECIEIKKSSTFKVSMLASLKDFEANKTYLLYQGKSDQYQGIEILNYQEYLNRRE